MHKGLRSLALAGALVGAAAALSAWAMDDADFEQAILDARGFVAGAKSEAAGNKDARRSEGKQATDRPAAAEDQVARRIVVFADGVGLQQQAKIVGDAGGTITHDLHFIHAVGIVGPKAKMEAFSGRASDFPEVDRVEEDFYQNWLVGSAAPGAPAALPEEVRGEGWWPWPRPKPKQETPWGIERVHAKDAWGVTKGAGVKVAVVDTGVDTAHPDVKVAGGYNAIKAGDPYNDDNGHGTHVAGTIAALDNNEGVVGVAPEVSLWAVKVLNKSGSGTFSDVIAGLQWCAEHGVVVANFSLGADQGTQALADAVSAATRAGVAIIAAAGNSGGAVGYPGAYPDAVAVAAMDKDGKVAGFSSRGPQVALIAPGVNVKSAYMGGGYKELSGTSMATPHVSGLAALAIAARGLRGAAEIRAALRQAATPLADAPPDQQGAGLVDAGRLVRPR